MQFSEELKRKQKTLDSRKKLLKLKATPAELILKGLLLILKPKTGRAIFQKGFIAGNGYCICDFYVPKLGVCIEVDGGYHWNEDQKKKDWFKNQYLTIERRLRVFRITNQECNDLTPDQLYDLLKKCRPKAVTYSPKYTL
jgi:very-short-patch-repair endonuclease